jgi:UDP-N-acetylmuramoyl-tripeptide--D-alanyl-D-alanine ligase
VIPLRWDEIAALGLGRLAEGASPTVITGVLADSRDVGPGDLFVALNTGVRYVDEAAARGAATLVPDDQEAALAALAALVRSKSDAQVVAVVGSTGKTSTKDILGALCAPHVPTIWSARSLNNELGVPLTVLRLEPATKVLVAEMGMRGLGQIAELCAVARPNVAVVTSIGPEHLELIGSVGSVARANAEAVTSLPSGGTAVVPDGVPELEPHLRRDDIEVRRFDPADADFVEGRGRFRIGERTVELELPFTHRHQAVNTLAALHAYAALGLPLEDVAAGASSIELSPWRGEERSLPGGGLVINDAYNANPDSMRAALLHLAERAGDRRRVAILGEMAELGDSSPVFHQAVGQLAATLEVAVIGVGERSLAYDPVLHAPDGERAVEAAREFLRPGDAVLVKASRSAGLEGIADEIANFAEAWSPSS